MKIKKACSIEGCERKHKAKGYCNYHYKVQRLRIFRASQDIKTRTYKKSCDSPQICIVENCANPYSAKGYCYYHYNQLPYIKAMRKAWREKNKQYLIDVASKWNKTNPDKCSVNQYNYRQRRKHKQKELNQ